MKTWCEGGSGRTQVPSQSPDSDLTPWTLTFLLLPLNPSSQYIYNIWRPPLSWPAYALSHLHNWIISPQLQLSSVGISNQKESKVQRKDPTSQPLCCLHLHFTPHLCPLIQCSIPKRPNTCYILVTVQKRTGVNGWLCILTTTLISVHTVFQHWEIIKTSLMLHSVSATLLL